MGNIDSGFGYRELGCAESIFTGQYCKTSLLECNELCKYDATGQCKSFHFHPRQQNYFANCNLKTKAVTSQSEITNNGGDWTLYWYETPCAGKFSNKLANS